MAPRPSERSLRRSDRLRSPDPNGRHYLAQILDWPRQRLDHWILSSTVKEHLQVWHALCVEQARRYDDAVEWINSGEQGYFYNKAGLEDDLLLLCLGEGDSGNNGYEEDNAYGSQALAEHERSVKGCVLSKYEDKYDSEAASTTLWITQELWARTAWRIVQANRNDRQAFARTIDVHPAACYAFAIDLLCLAFHSIAFRGPHSIWQQLICGHADTEEVQRCLESKIAEALMKDKPDANTAENSEEPSGAGSSESRCSIESFHTGSERQPSLPEIVRSNATYSARTSKWVTDQQKMLEDAARYCEEGTPNLADGRSETTTSHRTPTKNFVGGVDDTESGDDWSEHRSGTPDVDMRMDVQNTEPYETPSTERTSYELNGANSVEDGRQMNEVGDRVRIISSNRKREEFTIYCDPTEESMNEKLTVKQSKKARIATQKHKSTILAQPAKIEGRGLR